MIWVFKSRCGGLGQRSIAMSKEKHYEFVSRKDCQNPLQRTCNIIQLTIKNLKAKGIKSNYYVIGSAGDRNLVTCLVIDGKKQPIDIDINLEVDLHTVPTKYKQLGLLKELIRSEINKAIKECGEKFSDGQNSSSVITSILYDNKKNILFTFDVGIVSRNKKNELQRLVLTKKNNSYTWNIVFGTLNLREKAKLIKSNEDWQELRSVYLKFKNKYINDENYPSYVCYKMAVEAVYNQLLQECDELDYEGMSEAIGDVELSRSLEQLNILYQKGFITKPFYRFPEEEQTDSESVCWYFIDTLKDWDDYKRRGIGRGNNDFEAKIRAAYDILRFMLYDDDEEEEQEVYYCPYCGSEKESEDEICPVCFDD